MTTYCIEKHGEDDRILITADSLVEKSDTLAWSTGTRLPTGMRSTRRKTNPNDRDAWRAKAKRDRDPRVAALFGGPL